MRLGVILTFLTLIKLNSASEKGKRQAFFTNPIFARVFGSSAPLSQKFFGTGNFGGYVYDSHDSSDYNEYDCDQDSEQVEDFEDTREIQRPVEHIFNQLPNFEKDKVFRDKVLGNFEVKPLREDRVWFVLPHEEIVNDFKMSLNKMEDKVEVQIPSRGSNGLKTILDIVAPNYRIKQVQGNVELLRKLVGRTRSDVKITSRFQAVTTSEKPTGAEELTLPLFERKGGFRLVQEQKVAANAGVEASSNQLQAGSQELVPAFNLLPEFDRKEPFLTAKALPTNPIIKQRFEAIAPSEAPTSPHKEPVIVFESMPKFQTLTARNVTRSEMVPFNQLPFFEQTKTFKEASKLFVSPLASTETPEASRVVKKLVGVRRRPNLVQTKLHEQRQLESQLAALPLQPNAIFDKKPKQVFNSYGLKL